MKLRLYFAGPMTGYPNLNFPAFHGAASLLRGNGHQVVNPAEINTDPSADWLTCMRADIKQLVDVDAIVMLPGWEQSKGATLEHTIAVGLGLQVFALFDLAYPEAQTA